MSKIYLDVMQIPLRNRIHEMRITKAYSMEQLAHAVGITRQSLWMIEAGKVSPSTTVAIRLSKVFNCTVEQLFWEEEGSLSARTPEGYRFESGQQVRTYLGRIRGQTIARPISGEDGPGMFSLPAHGIIRAVEADEQSVQVDMLGQTDRINRSIFISGCDLGLGLLVSHSNRFAANYESIWFNVSNRVAMQELKMGRTHIAAIHMKSPSADLPQYFDNQVHSYLFASEEIGWILPKGNPRGFRGPEDFAGGRLRLINRPPGAGAREVLDEVLAKVGISTPTISGYANYANGHYNVARAVSQGHADVGVGLASAAALLDLTFMPIQAEQCWLLVPNEHENLEGVQAMLQVLHSDTFRMELRAVGPYDVESMGRSFPR